LIRSFLTFKVLLTFISIQKLISFSSFNIFRLVDTQHQWRFDCVSKSAFFPNGCKTAYKAYSSDQVVEFVKMEKTDCDSEIGKAIGLEATTVNFSLQDFIFYKTFLIKL
jgi:hypothetical protein